MRDEVTETVLDVKMEVARAKNKHPGNFHSAHEGFAVLLEEVDELKAEVWRSKHDKAAMRTEAIHVAAMAVRFASELCAVVPESAPSTLHKLDCNEYHHHQPDKGCCALDCPACAAKGHAMPPAEASLQKIADAVSTQPCGCDPGANHPCATHPNNYRLCGYSRPGYDPCVRPANHGGRAHRDATGQIFVEVI